MSPACRASNGAIPPVWWRRHWQARHARVHAHAIGPTFVLVRALGVVLHAIRLGEFSTASANVAVSTIWRRGGARCWGNCMRHSLDSSPGGDHALPLVALLVAQPLAPLVALLVGQAVALLVAFRWWLVVGVGMVRDGTPCGGAVPVGFVVLWRCPTLPQPIGCSTIGAAGLSFQVRNGAGRFPGAVTTTRFSVQHAPHQVIGGVWVDRGVHSGCGSVLPVLFHPS